MTRDGMCGVFIPDRVLAGWWRNPWKASDRKWTGRCITGCGGGHRIIKSSSQPRNNLRKTERAALKTLKDNTNLTILPADKEIATVVLNTSDYKQKISSLLEDSAYRKLAKDPTDAIERKTTLLLKKSSLTEETRRQLRPAGSRPPRMYGLPKIHKEGIPLRPIVSNIGTPTY